MPFFVIQDVAHTGTALAVQLSIFAEGFLLEHGWLIAPAGDADVHASIGTFLIPGKTHHVGNTVVQHQDFYSREQISDILLPEGSVPTTIPVKACETVELHDGVAVFAHHANLLFNQLRIRHIVEGENIMTRFP